MSIQSVNQYPEISLFGDVKKQMPLQLCQVHYPELQEALAPYFKQFISQNVSFLRKKLQIQNPSEPVFVKIYFTAIGIQTSYENRTYEIDLTKEKHKYNLGMSSEILRKGNEIWQKCQKAHFIPPVKEKVEVKKEPYDLSELNSISEDFRKNCELSSSPTEERRKKAMRASVVTVAKSTKDLLNSFSPISFYKERAEQAAHHAFELRNKIDSLPGQKLKISLPSSSRSIFEENRTSLATKDCRKGKVEQLPTTPLSPHELPKKFETLFFFVDELARTLSESSHLLQTDQLEQAIKVLRETLLADKFPRWGIDLMTLRQLLHEMSAAKKNQELAALENAVNELIRNLDALLQSIETAWKS